MLSKAKTYRKEKKDKKKIAFQSIYWVGILLMVVFGFLSNSYFAYDIKDMTVYKIIFYVLMFALLITALVDDIMKYKHKLQIWQSYIAYSVALLLIFLRFFIDYEIWRFISFIMLLAMTISVLVLHYKRKSLNKKIVMDKKVVFVVGFSWLLQFLEIFYHYYLNEIFLAWALIPASVLLLVIVILSFTVFKKLFYKLSKTVGSRLLLILASFVLCYAVSVCGIDTINTTFSPAPTQNYYEIVAKDVSGGGRGQSRRFIITIIIDEKEVDIDVPSNVYYENEVGGMLQVGYYKGALGFAFYEYVE